MNDNDAAGDFAPLRWVGNHVELLDQRRLPAAESWLALETSTQVAAAIRDMAIRGAPAIGIAAAYGVVLAARQVGAGADWQTAMKPLLDELLQARPTAVNLQWAIDRMRSRFRELGDNPEPGLLAEARAIHREDVAGNRRMGALGAEYVRGGILTHCNAGALATGGYGTALGVIRAAYALGNVSEVFAGETRPWLQGSRLTAWELLRDGIPVTLVADSAAAELMRTGRVAWVVVGADRIAANGDVANKIGTYALAVLARHHGVRFMVAAPVSTIDPRTPDGRGIPIEARGAAELTHLGGQPLAAAGVAVFNPVFDVTPAHLVDVLVTEKGTVESPDRSRICSLLGHP